MSTTSPNLAPTHSFKEKAKEEFVKAIQLTYDLYGISWQYRFGASL
jgi:hypothetical protein